jgi:toxin ParE1/3/4
MKFNLIISDPANLDLENIADYLSEKYGLTHSEKVISEVAGRIKCIVPFPYIGQSRDKLLLNSRSLTYSQYLIFYQVRGTTIEIIRIAHGYQDLTKLFDN